MQDSLQPRLRNQRVSRANDRQERDGELGEPLHYGVPGHALKSSQVIDRPEADVVGDGDTRKCKGLVTSIASQLYESSEQRPVVAIAGRRDQDCRLGALWVTMSELRGDECARRVA